MDRQKAKAIGERVGELLKPLEEEFGIKVFPRGGTYDVGGSFKLKVDCNEIRSDGLEMDAAATRLAREASYYGLPANCVGAEFEAQGEKWILVGISGRSSRRPFRARKASNGRIYNVSESGILKAFGVKDPNVI